MNFKDFIVVLCVYFSVLFVNIVESARILAVFPIPSASHQYVFRQYIYELARNGHDIVVITSNPNPESYNATGSVTQVDMSDIRPKLIKMMRSNNNFKVRGVIMETDPVKLSESYRSIAEVIIQQFQFPQIKTILEDDSQHFDLVVVEAFLEYQLIFGHLFKAPVILLSSFHGFLESYEMMGAVARHPLYYPHFHRTRYSNLSFWEKIQQIYIEYKLTHLLVEAENLQNKVLKKQFGPGTPTINELRENVQLLFLNSHPLIANNRPIPPNVIYLGRLHLPPVKSLPQDLKSYLDNAQRGVVYVSFGGNVMPSLIDPDLLEILLNAFESLPYDVLWKFDGDTLVKHPNNLKIEKWFPQRDLLVHPNIKLFVTQGGLQSMDEAIDAGVPLVGIPIIAEQWYNVHKFQELGIGKALNTMTITAEELSNAIKTVIGNESYRTNILKLRDIVNDEPETPQQRAVWWTEYVLRHKDARHLRSPAFKVPWTEYYMLEVLLPALFVVLAIYSVIFYFVITLTRPLFNRNKLKTN
ncbi:UDP-glycosyltransferase UGT4-like [Aphomia sociella]